MKPRTLSLFAAAAAALTVVGCERKTVVVEAVPATPVEAPEAKTKTLETSRLGSSIDAYERNPTAENNAAVKKAIAELDGEIAELDELVAKRTGESREEAAVKAKNLKSYRAGEVARFTAAQAKSPLTAPASAAEGRTGVEKVENGARRVGESLENAAKTTGDAVKDAVR
jgi:hypothetical protein